MAFRKINNSAATLIALFSMFAMTAVPAMDFKTALSIDVAPQSLEAALLDLSAQGHLQLVIATHSMPVTLSRPISGNMPLQTAFELLLEDTGLAYKIIGDHTIAIIKAADAPGEPHRGNAGLMDRLDEVVVTGTRAGDLAAGDSPAPIQILSQEALRSASGSPDLMSTLAQIVPSLTMQPFGADMAGQTPLAKLRGLSPNHVLVLVNGKRRHSTANLSVDSGSPYQGGAGVDLNFVPVEAIDHIEVLTEDAAAQYGTDAIAGVINIILKKNSSGGNLDANYGNYMDGGGNTGDVAGNVGLTPKEGAYLNLTGEVRNHGHSNQGAIDERIINPANTATYPNDVLPNIPGYPYLNQIMGDAEAHTKMAMLNAGFDFEGGTELYGFGSYADKQAASYENYRLPSKVCYSVDYNGLSAAAQASTSCAAQPDAVIPFPLGFSPQEATKEHDYSLTGGVKGIAALWNWDFSTTFGGDKVDMYTLDSANAGMFAENGIPGPLNYRDGYLQADQWTSNADFNRNFLTDMTGPLNVAFGGEYRRETYTVGVGDPNSYLAGGSQGFPGFAPSDSGTHERNVQAGYVDFALKPISGLLVDAAGRIEHYSDFGDAAVGKLTTRYDFTPRFAVRGTVSNGFRAPTLAEEYYSSTVVTPVIALVQLPPNSPGGRMLGLGDGLQPERSVNLGLGFVWRPTPGMYATFDAYQIAISNRIVGTGNVYGTIYGMPTPAYAAVTAAIAANGTQIDPQVLAHGSTGIVQFANGIDTVTRGADFMLDFPLNYEWGHVDWSIGATFNLTEITRVPPTPVQLTGAMLYSQAAESDVTTADPRYVIDLGALWSYENFTMNLMEKIYGPSAEYEQDNGDNPTRKPEYFQSEIGVTATTNLDVSYQFKRHLRLSIGALNLFNRFPPKLNAALRAHEDSFAYGDNQGVQQYPQFSPFGINGGFYYARATFLL